MKNPWETRVNDLLTMFPRSPADLGTQRVRQVLSLLSDPQKKYPTILVSGTNGKGSVAAFLEAILRHAGYSTGLYTSPHLRELTERISVNGANIRFEDLYTQLSRVREVTDAGLGLSYFEVLTAAAFLTFEARSTDIAILEVGLGGRLDATNVVDPLVSVITSISMDHQRLLGDTLQAIAVEKAGITRPGTPVVYGTPRALFDDFLEGFLQSLGGRPEVLGREFQVRPCENGFTYHSSTLHLKGLIPSLPGAFQYENAALVVRTIEHISRQGFFISQAAIRNGIARTNWPARLQIIASDPITVVDGAHNTGAALRLRETLRKTFKFNKLIMVHSSKPNKDYPGFLRVMKEMVGHTIETSVDGLEDPDKLLMAAQAAGIPAQAIADPHRAVHEAWQIAGPDDLVLICGSLYLAGEILRWFDAQNISHSRTA